MSFLLANGLIEVVVPVGQKICVTSYGAGTTKVETETGPNNYPTAFSLLKLITNSDYTSPVFTKDTIVKITAGLCDVEYIVGINPFPTISRVTTDNNGSFLLDDNTVIDGNLSVSGLLGLGVTPSAWSNLFRSIQIRETSISDAGDTSIFANNWFFDAGNTDRYITTGTAQRIVFSGGDISFQNAPSGTANNPITFTQAMTLTQGGNLLVGTTTDSGSKVKISGGNAVAADIDFNQGIGTGTEYSALRFTASATGFVGAELRCINTNGGANLGVLAIYTSGTERARITSGGYSKFSNTGVYGSAAGVGDVSNSGDYVFQTNGIGSLGGGVNVITNQTSASAFNYRSFLPSSATGFHYFATTSGLTVYQVLANGNVQNTNNSYGAISDIKLKENITDATPKLAKLNQLRVVNYNLKADESKLKQIGLIAQEVEQIFPGLVESTPDTVEVTKTRIVEVPAVLDEEGNEVTPATTTEETYTEREPNGEVTKAVKYSVLVPILVQAVKELSAQNAALESRLAALESK